MREEISFYSDGVALRGWFVRPDGAEPIATIVAMHGLASTIDFVDPLAAEFVGAGFSVLAFDQRGLGRSDGEPRQEVDPWRQVQDARNAISFLSERADVDADRIGMWGASMGGGVAVTTAALDLRVRCVVAVSLVASGWGVSQLMTPEEQRAGLQAALDEDRLMRLRGSAPATFPLLPDVTLEEALRSSDDSVRFVFPLVAASEWARPYVTLRSLEHIRDFEPLAHAHRIAPRAIMLIVASDDRLAPTAHAQALIDSIPGDRKTMKVIKGGHYAPLDAASGEMTQASIGFFREQLLG